MILGLLWIIGIYGFCAVLVHGFHRFWKRRAAKERHYIIVTHNNQQLIEWYMGSLFLFSFLKGEEIKVTIADEGSTDDTIPIAERLAAAKNGAVTVSTADSQNWMDQPDPLQERIVVELNKAGDVGKLPLVY
ncbi:hypothetical protein [Paenibacillus gansuensis]|uniref:Glycosyltransferase 2-like domain-containing protein n=1 Tax=Paenibacillus gansuensis TaxID=306542 RepID=A0ABW5PME5_9BACL